MNPLEELRERLKQKYADSAILPLLDHPPDRHSGSWFLDINLPGYLLVVEWGPDRGFGIAMTGFNEAQHFGEGPDEIYTDSEKLFERIIGLIAKPESTRKDSSENPEE